jgi:adenylyltransferase/sulfurtransferase
MEGQITVFPCDRISPCYRCLYPSPSAAEGCRSCANAGETYSSFHSFFPVGVLGPVPGIIGSLQAVETIKLLTQSTLSDSTGTCRHDICFFFRLGINLLIGRQLYYDGITGEFHTFSLPPRRPNCLSCGDSVSSEPLLRTEKTSISSSLPLLSDTYQISVGGYREILSAGTQHVLIDVRSPLQYNMISLPLEKYIDPIPGFNISYLNVPYTSLRNELQREVLMNEILSIAQTGGFFFAQLNLE